MSYIFGKEDKYMYNYKDVAITIEEAQKARTVPNMVCFKEHMAKIAQKTCSMQIKNKYEEQR